MMPGFSGLGLTQNSEAVKKRSKEAPEPQINRRATVQLDGNAGTEDLMMQIDQEEKKVDVDRESGIRRSNTQAMSMRPKSVGSKDILGLQGLAKVKQNRGIRPPELDRGTEVNQAGEKDE